MRSSSTLPPKSRKEPGRRKSTHNTVGSSRPPPLAISPLIKTEPVDVHKGVVSSRAGVVSATFGKIIGFTHATPSEETEEDEIKPSTLQPREMSTNEQQPSEIGVLYIKRDTDTICTDSTVHPLYNPSVSTASTILPPDSPSVSTAFTIHPPDNLDFSTVSTVDPSDNPSLSTAFTELPSYGTVRSPTDLITANRGK